MKKIIKCCILAITISIVPLVPFSSLRTSAIEIMPDSYLSYSDFYEQINNNLDNLEIKVIGNYDFETSFALKDEEGRISDSLDISEKVLDENNYSFKSTPKSEKGNLKALIISNEEAKNYSNFEGKEKIENALEQGYLAIFLIDDLKTADVLFSKYTRATTSTRSVDDNDPNVPYACYVAKNNIGEYYTGTFYINIDALEAATDESWSDAFLKKMKDETILYHAWCLRDIKYYTKNSDAFKKQIGEKSIDLGVITASASNDGDAFSIGSDWKSICGGWHENIIAGNNGLPSFSEWINFLYLQNGESGNHYYAWAIEYKASPNGWYTKYVDYQSDATMFMPQGKLRTYYPQSTPVDGSYSFNFGANISDKGTPSANIGFSRTVSTSDLKIVDTTNIDYGKIRFSYPWRDLGLALTASDYQKYTSVNNVIFIYKDDGKEGYYTFHHCRGAGFSSAVGLATMYTPYGNWFTTYYK